MKYEGFSGDIRVPPKLFRCDDVPWWYRVSTAAWVASIRSGNEAPIYLEEVDAIIYLICR